MDLQENTNTIIYKYIIIVVNKSMHACILRICNF